MTEDNIHRMLSEGPPDGDAHRPIPFQDVVALAERTRSPGHRRSASGLGGLLVAAVALGAVALVIGPLTRSDVSSEPNEGLPAAGAAASPVQSADAPSPYLPIDPSIKAVSLSAATKEEQRALELCTGFGLRVEDVAGMGEVARGTDVPLYVRLSGREPELKTDQPVWVVAFNGDFEVPRQDGRVVQNPICVVRDGDPAMFVPFGQGGSGVVIDDLPHQEYSLPPLRP